MTSTSFEEHRNALFIALCAALPKWKAYVWRAKQHDDGTMQDGWFIAGIGKEPGEQITYHLPDRLWDKLDFAETLLRAPKWDGHKSEDVIKRLMEVI